MIKVLDLNNVDKIVVVEAMGIHIGAVLSVMTDIPMTVMRKRDTSFPARCLSTRRPVTRKGNYISTACTKATGS